MLIIWGEKKTLRREGYVAEFCPVCRDIRCFSLTRVGVTGHMWYISFSKGRLAGHYATCTECGYRNGVDALNYISKAKSRKTPLPELIQRTFPSIHRMRGQSLEYALMVRSGDLPEHHRIEEIVRSISLFDHQIRLMPSPLTITKPVGLTMIATVLAVIGVSMLDDRYHFQEKYPDFRLLDVNYTILIIGAVICAVLMIWGRSIHVRRKILPMMARCLKPLEPAAGELKESLERLKAARAAIGKKVKVQPLVKEIEKAPSSAIKEEPLPDDITF